MNLYARYTRIADHWNWQNLLFGCLVFVFVVTGCARFESKPLKPPAVADGLDHRSLTNSTLEKFLRNNLRRELPTWPPSAWDFEMLTLAALYYHPALEVARAHWLVAKAGEQTAAQRPNPTLNVTPGYNTTTAMSSPWLPLGYLDVPIETAGKRGYRRAEAVHLSEAARLNLRMVAGQIRSSIRLALLALDTSDRRGEVLQKQFRLHEQILKALEQQKQAGAIAGSELLPLRTSAIKLQLEIADAQRSGAEARARLAESLGVPVAALQEIRISFESLRETGRATQLVTAESRRAALQSRPDILAALAEYAAAQSALQLEIAKQYPNLHLQPGYQFDQGDNKWSLGIILDLPLFHQNQGPIAEAKAKREESAVKFEALQARILAELERATEVLHASEQTVASFRSLAETQAQRRDAVKAEFNAGAAGQLEVLNAEVEYAAAELVQLDGESKFEQAVGAMEDALQQPLDLSPDSLESSHTAAR